MEGSAGQDFQGPGPGRGEGLSAGTGESGRQVPGEGRVGRGRQSGEEDGLEDAFGDGSEEALGGHPGGGGPRKSPQGIRISRTTTYATEQGFRK